MFNFQREKRNNNNMNFQGEKMQRMLNKTNIMWEALQSEVRCEEKRQIIWV